MTEHFDARALRIRDAASDMLAVLEALVEADNGVDYLHTRSCETASVPYPYPCDCEMPAIVAAARAAIAKARA